MAAPWPGVCQPVEKGLADKNATAETMQIYSQQLAFGSVARAAVLKKRVLPLVWPAAAAGLPPGQHTFCSSHHPDPGRWLGQMMRAAGYGPGAVTAARAQLPSVGAALAVRGAAW